MSLIIDDTAVPLASTHQYVPKLTNVTVSSTVTVTATSEMVLPTKLRVPVKGLIPHNYAGVFEPYYPNQSFTGFCMDCSKY